MTDITACNIARKAAAMWTRKAAALLVKAQQIDMDPDNASEDAEEVRTEAHKAERLARAWDAKAAKGVS